MEEELELIQQYRTLKDQLGELIPDLYYAGDAGRANVEESLRKKKSELDDIEEKLKTVVRPKITGMKKESIVSTLKDLIELMKFNTAGYPLSRNQGMIIDNFIFGKVILFITDAFQDDYGGYPIPELYYEINGDFNHDDLKGILEEHYKIIVDRNFKNYLELESAVTSLTDAITQKWREET